MRWLRVIVIVTILGGLFSTESRAQTQMLLPYNFPVFQATWENPAVRPQHRFSLGLPVISSIETGIIENGFTIANVSKEHDGKLYIQGSELQNQLNRHKLNMLYSEASFDIFHFRMMWRNYYFWIGARNVLFQSNVLPRELTSLVIKGNKDLIGKETDFTGLGFDAIDYHEFTFGVSKMMERWTFGVRASLLTGLFDSHLRPDNILLRISDQDDDYWAHEGRLQGELLTSCIPTNRKNNMPAPGKVDPAKVSWVNFNNPGFALAGGFTFRPEPRTQISFSFSDLGMIRWGDSLVSYTVDVEKSRFAGFSGFTKLLRDGKIDWDQLNRNTNNPLDSSHRKIEEGVSYTTWLSPRMHFIASYDLARQTTAAVSFSAIYHQRQFFPSVTLSLQQGYSNLLLAQVAVSYNQRSFLNVGASLVLCPGPVQFYVITDNLLGFIKPTMLNATNLRLGINIVWGPLYPNNHKLTHQ